MQESLECETGFFHLYGRTIHGVELKEYTRRFLRQMKTEMPLQWLRPIVGCLLAARSALHRASDPKSIFFFHSYELLKQLSWATVIQVVALCSDIRRKPKLSLLRRLGLKMLTFILTVVQPVQDFRHRASSRLSEWTTVILQYAEVQFMALRYQTTQLTIPWVTLIRFQIQDVVDLSLNVEVFVKGLPISASCIHAQFSGDRKVMFALCVSMRTAEVWCTGPWVGQKVYGGWRGRVEQRQYWGSLKGVYVVQQ